MRSRAAVNSLGSYPKDRRFESDLRNHLKSAYSKISEYQDMTLNHPPYIFTHFVKIKKLDLSRDTQVVKRIVC